MSDDALPIDILLAQGCCCGSECENCPYIDEASGARHVPGTTNLNTKWIEAKKANDALSYSDFQAGKR